MSQQDHFNYNLKEKKDSSNFFVNYTNQEPYDIIINNNIVKNIFLNAPNKSGKSHLINIWIKNNNAILYEKNLNEILDNKKNIAIDNIFYNINEENIFHIINHCNNENLKVFVTSNLSIDEHNFKIIDLKSRLKAFYYVSILNPDDEMVKIILTKLLYEKQFIIKNPEIFEFLVKRIERSYQSIYNLVDKLDKFSLQKKRQLTIPLIKEIL
tara:strand:- start:682 stop:1314 length:633 start_codon:yes stop_codon:yes gene_type:complete